MCPVLFAEYDCLEKPGHGEAGQETGGVDQHGGLVGPALPGAQPHSQPGPVAVPHRLAAEYAQTLLCRLLLYCDHLVGVRVEDLQEEFLGEGGAGEVLEEDGGQDEE